MAYILIASSIKTEKAKQKNFNETFPLEPCFSLYWNSKDIDHYKVAII